MLNPEARPRNTGNSRGSESACVWGRAAPQAGTSCLVDAETFLTEKMLQETHSFIR